MTTNARFAEVAALAGDPARAGMLHALMDGRALTAWRTACASALAARYLAREDASHLVMVGAGALAPHLIRAHLSVRPIKRVTLWNRTRARAVSLGFGIAVAGIEVDIAETLEEAVAQELQVSALEAQEILHQVTLAGGATMLDSETHARALDAVRLRLTPFARELVSSLQFYQSQEDSLGIREVVLAGGTAQLGGLAETLQGLIGVNVRVGDPIANVGVGKKAHGAANPALAVPIGLGMATS